MAKVHSGFTLVKHIITVLKLLLNETEQQAIVFLFLSSRHCIDYNLSCGSEGRVGCPMTESGEAINILLKYNE